MLYGQINADIGFLKMGRMLMTYFDIDQDGYRTASDSWSIKAMSWQVAFINVAILILWLIILT